MPDEIWFYDSKKKIRLNPVQNAYLLKRKYRKSARAQEILQKAKDKSLWFKCGCSKDDVIMYPSCMGGTYSLTNHSKLGVHKSNCSFETLVKGEDRETEEDSGVVRVQKVKPSNYRIFNDYASGETSSKLSISSGRGRNRTHKDSLLALLCDLYAFSKTNKLEPPYKQTPKRMLMDMRNIAASKLKMGRLGCVKDHLFFGPDGHEFLISHLKRWKYKEPNLRHQAILILYGDSVEIEQKDNKWVITLPYNKEQFSVISEKEPVIPSPFTSASCQHSVFIGAYAFPLNKSKEPLLLRCAIQPVHPDMWFPIDSSYERDFASVLRTELNFYKQTRFIIRKPVKAKIIDSVPVLPDFMVSCNEHKKQAVIEVMGRNDESYINRKKTTVPLMNQLFGPVYEFLAYPYAQKPEALKKQAQHFIRIMMQEINTTNKTKRSN